MNQYSVITSSKRNDPFAYSVCKPVYKLKFQLQPEHTTILFLNEVTFNM